MLHEWQPSEVARLPPSDDAEDGPLLPEALRLLKHLLLGTLALRDLRVRHLAALPSADGQDLLLNLGDTSAPQHAAKSIDCLRRNTTNPTARNVQRSLKTRSLSLAKEAPRAILVGELIEAPSLGLSVAVPRNIHRRAVLVLKRDNRRLLRRQASPVEPEGAVVLHRHAKVARVHVRVEDGSAVGLELGHGTRGTPVDERVATGQNLRRALALGEQVIRGVEALDQVGPPGTRVHADDLPAARRRCVHLPTAAVLRTMGAVIVQTQDLLVAVLGQPASVVLEAKVDTVAEVERRVCACQTPDDGSVSAVDLVHGTSVAGGDEVVASGILVDAVDVEVIPCVGAVVA